MLAPGVATDGLPGEGRAWTMKEAGRQWCGGARGPIGWRPQGSVLGPEWGQCGVHPEAPRRAMWALQLIHDHHPYPHHHVAPLTLGHPGPGTQSDEGGG